MRTLNQSGQAFIQVMLGLALVSLISGGAVTMIRSSQDEVQALAMKQGHLKLQEDINLGLQRSVLCKSLLHAPAGVNLAAGSVPLSVDLPVGAGTPGMATAAQSGADLPDYQVHVDGLSVTVDPAHPDLNPVLRGTLLNHNQLWSFHVRLEASSLPAGRSYKYVDLGPYYLETDGTSIVNCYGETDVTPVANATCEALGGAYTSGRCAIQPRFNDVNCSSGSLDSFTLSTADHHCVSVQPTGP